MNADQQTFLRDAMRRLNLTREGFSQRIGVTRRALDTWLLPEGSSEARGMPEIVQRFVSEILQAASATEAAQSGQSPALASCLQLAACTPNVAIQEMSLGIHYNVGHDLLSFCSDSEVLTPIDGYLPVPEKHGLGITIDEAGVRAADKDRHRWRNPIFRNADGSFAEW